MGNLADLMPKAIVCEADAWVLAPLATNIMTTGLNCCIGVLIVDPTIEQAFLVHIMGGEGVAADIWSPADLEGLFNGLVATHGFNVDAAEVQINAPSAKSGASKDRANYDMVCGALVDAGFAKKYITSDFEHGNLAVIDGNVITNLLAGYDPLDPLDGVATGRIYQ